MIFEFVLLEIYPRSLKIPPMHPLIIPLHFVLLEGKGKQFLGTDPQLYNTNAIEPLAFLVVFLLEMDPHSRFRIAVFVHTIHPRIRFLTLVLKYYLKMAHNLCRVLLYETCISKTVRIRGSKVSQRSILSSYL